MIKLLFLFIILSFTISDSLVIYVRNALHSDNLITIELPSDASINDLAQIIFENAMINTDDESLLRMKINFAGESLATFNLPIVCGTRRFLPTSEGNELLSETGICSECVVEYEVSQCISFKAFVSKWTSPAISYHLKEEKFKFDVSIGEKDFFGFIKKQLHSQLDDVFEDTPILFAIISYPMPPHSNRTFVLDNVRDNRLWEFLINGNVELIDSENHNLTQEQSATGDSCLELQRHSGFNLAVIKQKVLLSQLMDSESAYFCEQANDYFNFWNHRKGTRVRFTIPSNFDLLFN